jgi:hypothetical protein
MIFLSILLGISVLTQAQETLSPFSGVRTTGKVANISKQVEQAIQAANFRIIGQYEVAGRADLKVLCFTRPDLKTATAHYQDRGALASVLKIGIRREGDQVEVSILNPKYMFVAYFGKNYKEQSPALKTIDADAKNILINTFGALTDFGGSLETEELEKYHYKMMMPYFDDPIELETYDSFAEGLAFIRQKISESKADIQLVYELVDQEQQTAVFGIGMLNAETGEGSYLPIIGDRHIAALPYEIILQKNTVSMLHGKYRFALYWPELTMSEFMKIMSTPGDVEDMMEGISEL